jgi:hypothetical protein
MDSQDLNSENIQDISLNGLKTFYGEEIIKIMKTLEELPLAYSDYVHSEINELQNDYNNFYKEMKSNINKNVDKMIKAFKLDEDKTEQEYKERLDMIIKINGENIIILKNILNTHNQIFDTVKQNIKCLKKFLSLCSNFEKNTIHNFYEKEFENISRNWLLLKLNLEEINIVKILSESNLEQNYKDFLLKTCQNKNVTMVIQNPKFYAGEDNKKMQLSPEEDKKRRTKKEEDIKKLSEAQNNIIKLKMKNVNEADGYFIKIRSFSKLKDLLLDNITLKNNRILDLFPYLFKLRIKNCQSLDINLFKNISTNLKKLYLTKNGFVNYEFKKILQDYLLKSQSIRDNLEILSFANNNIGKINLSQIMSNTKAIFRALKEMDFRKNKITHFVFNKDNFPSLNCINLCDNNFNKDNFEEYTNIIVLQSGNSFLMDPKFRDSYFDRLSQTLSNNYTFPLNYLNISYLPEKYSKYFISQLAIAAPILQNLKKLTLSYNKLTCKTLFTFFNTIKEPINLSKLNLNGNELDDTFFEKYLEQNFALTFPKLQHISLSSNQIGNNKITVQYKDNKPIKDKQFTQEIYKLRMMYKFIEVNKSLNKINLTKNPISDIYTIVPEENNNADVNSKYIIKDDENEIIINCFFSFLIKIRDELLRNGMEYSRSSFNVKFDCRSNINKYSENYPFSSKPIIFKK